MLDTIFLAGCNLHSFILFRLVLQVRVMVMMKTLGYKLHIYSIIKQFTSHLCTITLVRVVLYCIIQALEGPKRETAAVTIQVSLQEGFNR